MVRYPPKSACPCASRALTIPIKTSRACWTSILMDFRSSGDNVSLAACIESSTKRVIIFVAPDNVLSDKSNLFLLISILV